MKNLFKYLSLLLVFSSLVSMGATATEKQHFSTDSLYREIIRTVADVDFKGMAAVYHPDAVLVTEKKSMPINVVMKRWKEEGEKFQKEGGTATLSFRFSQRKLSETTAFETGIFRYSTRDKKGTVKTIYSHFEDLNVKKNGQWLTIMEHQQSLSSETEWNNLPEWN
jgi:ketosteroid isomerase-like protein